MFVLEILHRTPVWVFVLFTGLVLLGVRRLRASDVPVGKLLLLPVAMTALSLYGLWQAFGASTVAAVAWVLSFAAMAAVGWVLPRADGVQYSPASRSIHVPGSWLPLASMMTIFFLRYATAVTLAMHPLLKLDPAFVVGIAALYGLSSGSLAARTANTWRSAFGRRTDGAMTNVAA